MKHDNGWCPRCSYDSHMRSIVEAQEVAEARNGKCLTTKYEGMFVKMRWECQSGHQWDASFNNIDNGTWCPACVHNSKRLSIEDAQKVALAHGGECVSTVYKNALSKLLWKCACGHTWGAVINDIRRGHWCPKCGSASAAKLRRLSIEVAQEAAAKKGGICLTTEYIRSTDKMLWQCALGHVWKTSYNNIQSGTWCPECAKAMARGTKRKNPAHTSLIIP